MKICSNKFTITNALWKKDKNTFGSNANNLFCQDYKHYFTITINSNID